MNQTTPSTANLQLHHNFRWILYSNHIEPVNGFLGRFLRRQLIEKQILNDQDEVSELSEMIEWIPQVVRHVNRFLEAHNSSDVTIGENFEALYISHALTYLLKILQLL